jgi:hypothetical protein
MFTVMEKGLERIGSGLRKNTKHIRTAGIPTEVGARYSGALQFDSSYGLHCRRL